MTWLGDRIARLVAAIQAPFRAITPAWRALANAQAGMARVAGALGRVAFAIRHPLRALFGRPGPEEKGER